MRRCFQKSRKAVKALRKRRFKGVREFGGNDGQDWAEILVETMGKAMQKL